MSAFFYEIRPTNCIRASWVSRIESRMILKCSAPLNKQILGDDFFIYFLSPNGLKIYFSESASKITNKSFWGQKVSFGPRGSIVPRSLFDPRNFFRYLTLKTFFWCANFHHNKFRYHLIGLDKLWSNIKLFLHTTVKNYRFWKKKRF